MCFQLDTEPVLTQWIGIGFEPPGWTYLSPVLGQGCQPTELSFSTSWLAYGSSISLLAHENLDTGFRLILKTNHVIYVHLSIRIRLSISSYICPNVWLSAKKNVRWKCLLLFKGHWLYSPFFFFSFLRMFRIWFKTASLTNRRNCSCYASWLVVV